MIILEDDHSPINNRMMNNIEHINIHIPIKNIIILQSKELILHIPTLLITRIMIQ